MLALTMNGEAAGELAAQAARAKKFAPDFWRYVLAAGFGAGSAWTTMLINQRVNEAQHAAIAQTNQGQEDRMNRIQSKLESAAADADELRGEVRQLTAQVARCAVKP